jgi:NAD(P)-dependent dehydrogenase (short-subunit alcohol dehydrogenase family)
VIPRQGRPVITGANKGLGYEAAPRLIADGHQIWVAARDPERGQAAAAELGARFVSIDVTDQESAEHLRAIYETPPPTSTSIGAKSRWRRARR